MNTDVGIVRIKLTAVFTSFQIDFVHLFLIILLMNGCGKIKYSIKIT